MAAGGAGVADPVHGGRRHFSRQSGRSPAAVAGWPGGRTAGASLVRLDGLGAGPTATAARGMARFAGRYLGHVAHRPCAASGARRRPGGRDAARPARRGFRSSRWPGPRLDRDFGRDRQPGWPGANPRLGRAPRCTAPSPRPDQRSTAPTDATADLACNAWRPCHSRPPTTETARQATRTRASATQPGTRCTPRRTGLYRLAQARSDPPGSCHRRRLLLTGGAESARPHHRGHARVVQYPGARGRGSARTGHHPVRARPCTRGCRQPHRPAAERPRPATGRPDAARASSGARAANGRHRGAQHVSGDGQARRPDHRAPVLARSPAHRHRHGRRGQAGGRRSVTHAAPAGGRRHRLGQKRVHQQSDHVAAGHAHAGRSPVHPDRPQAGRAQPVSGPAPPAAAGRNGYGEGGRGAALDGPGDGAALRAVCRRGRAQHRRVQRPFPRRAAGVPGRGRGRACRHDDDRARGR